MVPNEKVDLPLSKLFSELGEETKLLVQQEIALAKAELTRKASKAGKNAAYLGVGAAIGYAAFLALMIGLIFALATAIPLWGAAFIVGLVLAGVAGWLIYDAISALKKMSMTPRQTVETLKEDAQWLKDHVTS